MMGKLLHPTRTANAVARVLDERKRQDHKWGEQNHDIPTWLVIAMEELGEAAQAFLDGRNNPEDLSEVEAELISTAAVCVAAVENIRRNRK